MHFGIKSFETENLIRAAASPSVIHVVECATESSDLRKLAHIGSAKHPVLHCCKETDFVRLGKIHRFVLFAHNPPCGGELGIVLCVCVCVCGLWRVECQMLIFCHWCDGGLRH